eukprot:5155531-Amphidinium_carterae.1
MAQGSEAGDAAKDGAAAGAASGAEDERFTLLCSVGEECQTKAELQNLLQKKPAFNLYDGFEPSGRMHIAQGSQLASICKSTKGTPESLTSPRAC